jgi:RNA-binding protein 39
MFDPSSESQPGWDLDVREDVMEECSKFGKVDHCYVEKSKPGGLVFVRFVKTDASTSAARSLNGRFFAGRMITVTYLEPAQYNTLVM